MPRASPLFKQSVLIRALKGARAAGHTVDRIEIGSDGRIVLLTGLAASAATTSDNPWDEVMPDGKTP